jgi:uncharacterized protein (TIGR03067 family)
MKAGFLLVWSTMMGLGAVALAGDGAAGDRKKLQGTWKVVAGNEGGKTLTPARVKGTKMVVAGDKMTVHEQETTREMTFKLDPTKEPRAIDMTITEGKGKGEKSLGIYALEGDTLKIAFALPGKSRPANFTPQQGSSEMLFVMKRAQP